MKPLLRLFICSFGLFSLLATSTAHSRDFATVYEECGIGALIFSGDTDNNRILAIISNVTWDLGTTAHLSNVSSPDSCAKGDAQTAAFIMQTYPSLERELARGEGEYLAAMLEMRGCETNAHRLVISDLRNAMSGQLVQSGYAGSSQEEKAGVLFNTLENTITSGYTASCLI